MFCKKDEEMFRLERNAIQRPLKLTYDDYVIKRFNIPKGTTSVMMSDLIAGPLPGQDLITDFSSSVYSLRSL